MAELQNAFSWSFSAAADFDECPRRRYWSKYAMWGGWKENADPVRRAAYRLTKMHNGYSLLGMAVETAVKHALLRRRETPAWTVDDLYTIAARPFLNTAWKQSLDGLWRQDPKKFFCLREHYYKQIEGAAQQSFVAFIIEQTRGCLANFLDSVYPRLRDIGAEQEVAVSHPSSGGEPESFALEGIRIYAIPDFVYRAGEAFVIHDWKAGKAKPQHRDQMLLYALWAREKHAVPPERVKLYLEYLSRNGTEEVTARAQDLDEIIEKARISIADMADYLVEGDLHRNQALPKEEWVMNDSPETCRQCNFLELCQPELQDN